MSRVGPSGGAKDIWERLILKEQEARQTRLAQQYNE